MSDRLKVLADSYLDHIRIAVEAQDRGAPFRDFLDNWNAFNAQHGHHHSRGDRPRWFNNPSALARVQMLDALDFRSVGAAAILEDAARDPATYQRRFAERDREVKLVVDHAVPIGVIVADLFAGDLELTRESIGAYLNRWYRLGLLTHYEDASINALGLRSAMPVAWDREDPFARYEAAGIAKAHRSVVAFGTP